jgi:hypothetical protein
VTGVRKFYNVATGKNSKKNGARGRSRTGTGREPRGILSPLRLPISPPGHILHFSEKSKAPNYSTKQSENYSNNLNKG